METKKKPTKGLRFEYLIPHLSNKFQIYLVQDVKNIQNSFELTENASTMFKKELVKQLTKNGIKELPKPSFFQSLIYRLL